MPSPTAGVQYSHDNLSSCSILNVFSEDDLSPYSQRCSKYSCSCLCPCLVMGYMTNKLTRDDEFSPLYPGKQLPFGRQSLSECCIVSSYCAYGWLCSPCLIMHIRKQRRHLMDLYRDKLSTPTIHGSWKLLCWPSVLYQHLEFIQHQVKQKTLRFDDAVLSQPSPPIAEVKVVLVGPDASGRPSLFSKLLLLLPDTKIPTSHHMKTGTPCPLVEIACFYACYRDSSIRLHR